MRTFQQSVVKLKDTVGENRRHIQFLQETVFTYLNTWVLLHMEQHRHEQQLQLRTKPG